MKRQLIVILVIVLLLGISGTVWLVTNKTRYATNANTVVIGDDSQISTENCYLFASPLEALANGREKIRVTIFVLDGRGRGIPGITVFLGIDQRLAVTGIRPLTDELGRAMFDISSTTAADYYLDAQADRVAIPQRLKISFK